MDGAGVSLFDGMRTPPRSAAGALPQPRCSNNNNNNSGCRRRRCHDARGSAGAYERRRALLAAAAVVAGVVAVVGVGFGVGDAVTLPRQAAPARAAGGWRGIAPPGAAALRKGGAWTSPSSFSSPSSSSDDDKLMTSARTSTMETSSSTESSLRPATQRREVFRLPRPACASGRARSFLMVFMGHSGSSAIISELRQHPEILIEDPEAVDHPPLEFNTTAGLAYARAFFTKGACHGLVPGFKIRPWHIMHAPREWAALAREFDTRIIWQFRHNSLKQSVGEYSYRYLNDSGVLEGLRSRDDVARRCDMGAGCRFAIHDFDYFHHMLRHSLGSDQQIAEATAMLADGRDCVHRLPYEDYLYHPHGAMLDLHQFLGVAPFSSAPTRFKATGDNMCQVVSNWRDVCRNFYGCATWRPLFEDERNGCGCPFSMSPARFCDATPSYS